MALEPTISYGTAFQMGASMLGVFFACLFFVWTLRGRIDALSAKMTEVVGELVAVRTILEVQARMDERIISLEKRLDELRHGEGMVLPLRPASRVHV